MGEGEERCGQDEESCGGGVEGNQPVSPVVGVSYACVYYYLSALDRALCSVSTCLSPKIADWRSVAMGLIDGSAL